MNSKDIDKAAVIGAGTMGHSIALIFARAGIEINLVDVDEKALKVADERMRHALATLEDVGVIEKGRTGEIRSLIHTSLDLASCAGEADFVVEAVPEVPEIKKQVFAQLDKVCPEQAVIASNTSGLDIFEFTEMERPERLIIAHWFAPPHIIPLVELVPGPSTSQRVVEFTASLLERLGKVPVVMKGFTRAFIVNKIQNMISMAVFDLLGSGLASPEDIDRAVKYSLGIRLPILGVVQTLDFTGLDLVLDLGKSYGLSLPLIEEKVEKGHLGVKTSKGLYDYGHRSESEILARRDALFLKMLERLKELKAFDPI